MLDVIIWIWLAVFLILVAMHLHAGSTELGMIAGTWFLFLGLFIAVSGLQTQSGYTMTVVGSNTTISYDYVDIVLPYNTYSYLWGLSIILIGLYMLVANMDAKWGKKKS
jgi:hypothetical protein